MNGRTVSLAGTALTAVVVISAFGALRWVSASQSLGDANCDGTVNSIDATLVLQLNAGLLQSVACQGKVDVSADGRVDSLDASLILQFAAGLLDGLGPLPSPLEPTPDATPPGQWSGTSYAGTTAAGGEVRFVLSADGSAVLSFIAEWRLVCGGRYIGSLPVRGSFFSRSGESFTFTGVLEPPDSASGTVSDSNCESDVPWSASVE